jgi:aryl-alcohol dehydrogenase-like predicted oxidoreductase
MDARSLGRSAIPAGLIGLGCWAIGGPFWDQGGWMGYGEVDDAESIRALHHALELGVTFFDTANVYGCGHSERILGRALQQAGRLNNVIIADKFGWTFDENKREVLTRDTHPVGIRRALEDSLRRLGRDHIDLYQLHLFDHPLEEAAEVRETLEALVVEGKIRAYAWCTEDPARIRLFAEGPHCCAVPQWLNVLYDSPATLALCDELNLAALIRRPLGQGLLTGKFNANSALPENDMRHRFGWNFRSGKQALQLEQLNALRVVLTQDGRSLAQGAIGWIWARHPRTLPVPGFKTVKQVEENVGALRYGPLSVEQMNTIEAQLGR